MLKIKKKHGKVVKAYRLGDMHAVLEQLVADGEIIDLKDGSFEVFSQEVFKSIVIL